MGKLINYLGSSKILKRIADVLNVTDVKVNGTSVVDEYGVAQITGGGGASALDDLTDVNITSAADYQTLIYDSTDQEWQNGSLAFTNLSDVNISSPSNSQILKYDSTAGEWQNKNATWLPLSGGTVTGSTTFRKSNLTADAQITVGIGGKSSSSDTYGTDGIFVLANKSGSRIILYPPSGSFNYKEVYFPSQGGTLAMTTDIPTDFVPASTGGTFEGDVIIDKADGTTSANGVSMLTLGNNTASGTEGNSYGQIRLYTTGNTYMDFVPANANLMKFVGQLRVSRDNGTASSSENYTILEVGNNVANTSDGHAEGGIRVWDINGYRHTITGPELSSGKSTQNINYRLPGVGGYFVMSENVYVDDIPAYTPSGGTAYTAAQMVLYAHTNILKDGQKICAKVDYGTNDMFVMGYRRQASRGRYIFMTRTNDAVYSLRVTGSKAATYVQLDMGSGTNVTID